jgi:hypothetical protein
MIDGPGVKWILMLDSSPAEADLSTPFAAGKGSAALPDSDSYEDH